MSINAVMITIAVERPNGIFSRFKMNIATAAPPTTPGDNAEANSHNKITRVLRFQFNLFLVKILMRMM